MERCIFHLDLDAFFVAVERALDPSLEGRPVVVGGGPGRERGVVTCASYEARAYGLKAGMPLSTARRLCPQAVFIAGHPSRYREISRRFLNLLQSYTPFVEPLGLDEAFLDMTGFQALYGAPRDLACSLKQRVRRELGVTVSIGIATSKVVAKVASDYCKPDGLLEVPPGQEAAFLAPLPVGRLPGVGPKAEALLKGEGILTIGELALASPLLLRRLLGAWGDVIQRWAKGLDPRPVEPAGPAKSIGREVTLPQDTQDLGLLWRKLQSLGEAVGADLRRQGKLARCVVLKLRYADFHTITRRCTLGWATDSDEAILGAARALLERALRERFQAVRLLGISLAQLVSPPPQLSFLPHPEEKNRRLARAVDTIRRKYGVEAIKRASLLAGLQTPARTKARLSRI